MDSENVAPQFTEADTAFLEKALELAARGRGFVSPNPMVGAVVVREGEIVGTGYHRKFGGDHAEVEALREAGHLARGATLYCNLEPCSHFGKTPPCVNRIIESAVAKVVVGSLDPNPIVNGRGLKALRKHNIIVEIGLLEDACRRLNQSYFKFITTRIPFLTLKMAQSVDGKIADREGRSRWISNEESRRLVHRWRWQCDAVLVGIGTVLHDDPMLTVRFEEGPQPRRIVLDSHLRIPLSAKLLTDEHVNHTIVVASTECREHEKVRELEGRGAKVWHVMPAAAGSLNTTRVLERIGQEGIADVLVEGGRRVFSSLIEERHADQLACFVAPIIMGEGIPAISGVSTASISQAIRLENPQWHILGDNGLVTGRLKYI